MIGSNRIGRREPIIVCDMVWDGFFVFNLKSVGSINVVNLDFPIVQKDNPKA